MEIEESQKVDHHSGGAKDIFSEGMNHFFKTVYEAGDNSFQVQFQHTKKLREIIDQLMRHGKALELQDDASQSVTILILALLRSYRWQDNNTGLCIAAHFFSHSRPFLSKANFEDILRVYFQNFLRYLDCPEEPFNENVLQLFNDLQKKDPLPAPVEILNRTVEGLDLRLDLIQNKKGYLELLQGSSLEEYLFKYETNQENGYESRYRSKCIVIYFLQIIDSLKTYISKIPNCVAVIKKCIFLNQSKARKQAMLIISEIQEQLNYQDMQEVLDASLYDYCIEIRKIALDLLKRQLPKLSQQQRDEMKQRVVFFLINVSQYKDLQAITKDLLQFFGINEPKMGYQVIQDKLPHFLNLQVLQTENKEDEVRQRAWQTIWSLTKFTSQGNLRPLLDQIYEVALKALSKDKHTPTQATCFFWVIQFSKDNPEINKRYLSQLVALKEFLTNFTHEKLDKRSFIKEIIALILQEEVKTNEMYDFLEQLFSKLPIDDAKLLKDVFLQIISNTRRKLDVKKLESRHFEKVLDDELVDRVKNHPQALELQERFKEQLSKYR